MKERFLEFYYTNTQIFWVVVILLVAGTFGAVAMSDKKSEESQKDTDIATTLEKDVELVHDTFSLLQEYQHGYIEGSYAIEYDLYLKKPFLKKAEYTKAVNSLIKLIKYKYNDADADSFIAGIKMNVYDRYENYNEKGVLPRTTVTYMLREEDEKTRKEEDKYMEGYDMRWEHTISQEKMPDYSTYVLYTDYKPYDVDDYSPFSEKEYELYRKLMLYKELRGSLNSGIKAYMVWELGIPMNKRAVFVELRDFVGLGQQYGENSHIYKDQKSTLLKLMAVENPRYTAYIVTKKIYDDKLQAKRALVKENREYYLPLYVAEAQRIVKEVGGDEGITALEEITELENVKETTVIDDGYAVPQGLEDSEPYDDIAIEDFYDAEAEQGDTDSGE